MKQILTICMLALVFTQASAAICENYQSKISRSEIIQSFASMIQCVNDKQSELADEALTYELLQKQFYEIKFTCFQEIKNPSEQLKNLFQCLKNYYEAKYDTELDIPTLEDQKKGTDSDNWGDEELKNKVEQDYQSKTSSANIALYIFCVVLGIAILALLIAIIFSKYRMHVNKDSAALGQSSFEFGTSNANYQKQTNF